MEISLRDRISAVAEQADALLRDRIRLQGTLIQLLAAAAPTVPELRLPADVVRARLASGTPLLDGLDLPISTAASAVVERLAAAMLADAATQAGAESILTALRSHRLHAEQLIGEAAVSHADHLAALADAANAPADLLATLADLAARPLLSALAERLRPALRLGEWNRAWCPICGARPLFAEASDSAGESVATEQAESGLAATTPDPTEARLRCGRCTTVWAWSLPRCPTCSDGQMATIATRDVDGAGAWSVLGCSTCQTYLKSAAAPRPQALGSLLADDLATWTLDRAALAAGFARPAKPPRRLEHADLGGEDHDDD